MISAEYIGNHLYRSRTQTSKYHTYSSSFIIYSIMSYTTLNKEVGIGFGFGCSYSFNHHNSYSYYPFSYTQFYI